MTWGHLEIIFILVISSVLIVSSCARDRIDSVLAPPTPKRRLLLFAAGFCGPCKEELPEIRDWYKALSSSKQERLIVSVYLTGGAVAGTQATQAFANSFAKKLELPFEVKPDRFGRFYRTFYSSGNDVPATVITNEQGEPIHIFPPRKIAIDELESVLGKARVFYDLECHPDNCVTEVDD